MRTGGETSRTNIPPVDQQRGWEERKRAKRPATTVTKIRANNETSKQINFAGDLFIETSSAELF